MRSGTDTSLVMRDVSGPSAFGGQWSSFWNLLWVTSVSEFKVRYAGARLKYLWTLLRPLLLFGVVFLVLRAVINFGAGVEHYAALLMFNIILFQYFRDATSRAVRSLAQREHIVRKMKFPRIVIPLSVSLTAAFTLCLNLVVGLGLLLVMGVEPRWTWFLLPAVMVVLVLLTTGVSLILSVAFVRSRDVDQVWGVTVQMLFYLSPILYPIELVPDPLRQFVTVNPLAPIFVQVRVWMIDPSAPNAVEAAGGMAGLLLPVLLLITICAVGVWLFDREAPRVAEAL